MHIKLNDLRQYWVLDKDSIDEYYHLAGSPQDMNIYIKRKDGFDDIILKFETPAERDPILNALDAAFGV